MLIEPNAPRMHQNRSQETIAQVPQIARPDTLELTAVRMLAEDGVNAVSPLERARRFLFASA